MNCMMDREYSEFAAMQLWVETRKGSNGAGEMGMGESARVLSSQQENLNTNPQA